MKIPKIHVVLEPGDTPVIELDDSVMAAYIKFRNDSVAKTVEQSGPYPLINFDYNADDRLIGVEIIGHKGFQLEMVAEQVFENSREILEKAVRHQLTP